MLVFTSDSKSVVTISPEVDSTGNRVSFWDIETGRPTATASLRMDSDSIRSGQANTIGVSFPSSDELLIAAFDFAGTLRLDRLRTSTGAVLERQVSKVNLSGGNPTFSPDGTAVVTVTNFFRQNKLDAELNGFRLPNGEKTWTLQPEIAANGGLGRCFYSPDGARIIVGIGDTLWCFESRTGRTVLQLGGLRPGNRGRVPYGFDPTGRWLAFLDAGQPLSAGVWDLSTGEVRNLEGVDYYGILVTAEGLVARAGGTIGVWSPATGKKIRDIPLPVELFPWVASPDGRYAAKMFGSSVAIWDTRTGKPLPSNPCPLGDIVDLMYRDSKTLTARIGLLPFIFGQTPIADGGRITWETVTARPLSPTSLQPFPGRIDVSPDGLTAVAFRDFRNLEFRDATTAAVLKSLKLEGPAYLLASGRFTGDGTGFLVPIAGTNQLKIWNVKTGDPRTITFTDSVDRVPAGQFSLGGLDRAAIVTVAKSGRTGINDFYGIAVVELATGKSPGEFRAPGTVTGVTLTPDGKRVGIVSYLTFQDPNLGFERVESATVHEASGGAQLCRVPLRGGTRNPTGTPTFLALSADGRTLVTADGSTGIVWEVATGRERIRFQHRGDLLAFAVSPEGRVIAVASRDAPIWEWDYFGSPKQEPADVLVPDDVWNDLGNPDAARGFRSIRALIATPVAACRWLEKRIPPAPALDATEFKSLLANLADPDFRIRDTTEKRLVSFDGSGLTRLRKELSQSTSAEKTDRLHRVIDRAAFPISASFDGLRKGRALEAVEHMALGGSDDARALLEKWATGEPDARLTRDAVAAKIRTRR